MTTEKTTANELLNIIVEASVKNGTLPITLNEKNKQYLEEVCQRLDLNKIEVGSVLIGLTHFITKYQEEGWNLYLRKDDKEIKLYSIKELNKIKKHKE